MDTPTPLVPSPIVQPAPVLLPTHHVRWKLISAIFIVALFAGFEAYYFINKSIPEPIIPTYTTRPTSDPTADWKTYWNRQYGFEMKYPEVNKFEVPEVRNNGAYIRIQNYDPTLTAANYIYKSGDYSVEINIPTTEAEKSALTCKSYKSEEFGAVEYSPFKISSDNATAFFAPNVYGPGGGPYSILCVTSPKKMHISSSPSIANQIFSSLKFTE